MRPSGKFVLRVGPDLHRTLKERADAQSLSLNQYCLNTLDADSSGTGSAALEMASIETLGLIRYGSAVRGENTESSDIDWLVVVPKSVEITRALYDELDRIPLPDPKISLHASRLPVTDDELSNFWLELALEAEVLSDPTGAIRRRLIEIRRKIASGAFKRHLTHGQPYWTRGSQEKDGKKNAKSKVS